MRPGVEESVLGMERGMKEMVGDEGAGGRPPGRAASAFAGVREWPESELSIGGIERKNVQHGSPGQMAAHQG